MGYAIFTARKLMLRNRINQINFRMLQLTQQQQTLADQASRWERAMANTRTVFSQIGNIFQMGMNAMVQKQMQELYNNNVNGGGGTQDYSIFNTILSTGGLNFMATPVGAYMNMMSQSLDMANQNQLQRVKDMENQIELQMKSLETQLKAAQAEMESVEKAEDNEIKSSAPKFA